MFGPEQVEDGCDFADRLIAVVSYGVGHLAADLAALVHEGVVEGDTRLVGDRVEEFPEERAEAVDVKAVVRARSGFIHLLGGGILGSVDLEVVGVVDRAGAAQVDQEDLTEVVEYKVGRLDVPVYQTQLVDVVKEQGDLVDHGDHEADIELMAVKCQKIAEVDPADLRHNEGTALICFHEVDDRGGVVLVVEKQKLLQLISEESFVHTELGGVRAVVNDPLHNIFRAGPVGFDAVDFAAAAFCQELFDLIEVVERMIEGTFVGALLTTSGSIFLIRSLLGFKAGYADAVGDSLYELDKTVVEAAFLVEVDVLEAAQHELKTPGEAEGLEKYGHHFFGIFVGVGDLVLNVMGRQRGFGEEHDENIAVEDLVSDLFDPLGAALDSFVVPEAVVFVRGVQIFGDGVQVVVGIADKSKWLGAVIGMDFDLMVLHG